jgi:purine-cytosine permease-like protein
VDLNATELGLGHQAAILFLLAIPIACIAWTVTHEEIVREPREYCVDRSRNARSMATRKFFYLFTCEYCFSHYVTLFFLWLTGFHLLLPDWRGYVIAGFSLVFIANSYMSAFGELRLEIRQDRQRIARSEVLDAKLLHPAPPKGAGPGVQAPVVMPGEERH